MTITFTVLGDPAPQGSKTAVMRAGKPAMIEGGSATGRLNHSNWRTAVAWSARKAAPPKPMDGPLALEVVFRIAMPASRQRKRTEGYGPHAVSPDLDKLIRSTGDGLKVGGMIVDDARIAAIRATAIEVVGWTGAVITIGPWGTSGDCEFDCLVMCNGQCVGAPAPWERGA